MLDYRQFISCSFKPDNWEPRPTSCLKQVLPGKQETKQGLGAKRTRFERVAPICGGSAQIFGAKGDGRGRELNQ